MDPISLLAAFIPLLIDGVKQGINYWTGGPKPTTVQDLVALRELDIRQLEALTKLDAADGASRWVINIRGLQRPIATIVILFYFGLSMYYPVPNSTSETLSFLAQCAFFYLFGERTLSYARSKPQR